MATSRQYAEDCLALLGRVFKHDDALSGEGLLAPYCGTRDSWQVREWWRGAGEDEAGARGAACFGTGARRCSNGGVGVAGLALAWL